jgi:hypothetical protein
MRTWSLPYNAGASLHVSFIMNRFHHRGDGRGGLPPRNLLAYANSELTLGGSG